MMREGVEDFSWGWFERVVDLGDGEASEWYVAVVTGDVVVVVGCCPFAKGFGVESVGEGDCLEGEGVGGRCAVLV